MADKNKKEAAKTARIRKAKMRAKYKKHAIIGAIIAVVLIVAVVLLLVLGGNEKPDDGTYTDKELQDILNSIATADPMQVVEPTQGTLVTLEPVATPFFAEKIELDPDKMGKVTASGLTFPYVIPEMDVTILMISSYSGPFIEDGSNEYVENCTAILIRNTGDTVLEYAEIPFIINNEKEALFKVSMLPPESCAIVLDSNKNTFFKDDAYMVSPGGASRKEALELNVDKIGVLGDVKQLTVKNLTDASYKRVVICYKNLYMEGLYFGGIAYARTFENLEAKGEMTLGADNYYPEVCQILKVDVYE